VHESLRNKSAALEIHRSEPLGHSSFFLHNSSFVNPSLPDAGLRADASCSGGRESKFLADISFVLCALASLGLAGFSYFWTNRQQVLPPVADVLPAAGQIVFCVDECALERGRFRARGWAAPVQGGGEVAVYLLRKDGAWLQARKATVSRPDVSAALKRPGVYDKSGFQAALAGVDGATFSGQIVLVVKDNAKRYMVKHACKSN
jgi:hypothetical protein